jgi:hypothetical protein
MAHPTQIGAPGEEERQSEQDDPGEQTQGQTQGEASAPAGAGDCITLGHPASRPPADQASVDLERSTVQRFSATPDTRARDSVSQP